MRSFFKRMSLEKEPIIIGITGHAQESFIQEGINAGMDEVYSKPFYYDNLQRILANINSVY